MHNFENDSLHSPFFYKSSCPAPIILHVSRESRLEGLKHYKLDFAVKHEGYYRQSQPVTLTAKPTIYFNWKVDRLCIINPLLLEELHCDCLERAEHLGRLCKKRKLQYLAYNCQELIDHENIFEEITDRAVWLQEIILFEAVFPPDKYRFNVNFKKCPTCLQGSCRCLANKWNGLLKHEIERLWKKQERKSNEKASIRFSSLTWILTGRKGKAQA
jgi:hypothetical protein